MKKVFIFFISLLITFTVHAHKNIDGNNLTVRINGNKNLQVSVDGRDYNLSNSSILGNRTTIVLNNLETGQHTLQIIRTDLNTMRSDRISAPFILRSNYEMLININANGSLELIENLKPGISDNQVPANTTDFNNLLRNVKAQRSASARRNTISTAFNNTSKYFSTNQVVQLLQLINAENFRLQLSKLSYRSVTDRSNFYQVYDLLNSQAGKDELVAYVNTYNEGGNSNPEMTNANFNTLYQTILQQWPVGTQMNSLINAFNNTSNYFTTNQASQLIQIVSAEANRLHLAKLSYRSITDPGNFNQIYNLLSTQASKNELAAYINNNGGSNSNSAMTDANFNNLYQTILQQWPVSSQMNSLTNAFNNTANYFTTNQASQLIQIVSAEANRLQLAKLSYRSVTDRGNFNQVYNLLNTQASKNELSAYINANNNTGNNPNTAMSDVNFNSLIQAIQQQWPVSTQMNSLTGTFNNTANYFTTFQASQLIQIVSDDANRLQLAKLSYRSVTDRSNFNQIYNLLSTQASKNELAAYLNTNYNIGTAANVAMTDANFNSLFQTIQAQYLPFEQMNSLVSAFNNTNNYFTSAQVKQLIPLVSLESNRLQLAKLSYRTIVDRNNFNQLYDLLNSQASKNDLEAYVKAYKD